MSDMQESPFDSRSVSPKVSTTKIHTARVTQSKKSLKMNETSGKSLSPKSTSKKLRNVSPLSSKETTFQLNAKTAKNVEKSLRLEMILEKKQYIAKKYGDASISAISPLNQLEEVQERFSRVKSVIGHSPKKATSYRTRSPRKAQPAVSMPTVARPKIAIKGNDNYTLALEKLT